MKLVFVFFCLLTITALSCKKDSDPFGSIKGTVLSQRGCFNNSYLVYIDDPDYSRHEFLRPSPLSSCTACANISNSAYVELPAAFAVEGTRIKFSFVESIPSCFSYSEAPMQIKVKNLVKL